MSLDKVRIPTLKRRRDSNILLLEASRMTTSLDDHVRKIIEKGYLHTPSGVYVEIAA